MNTVSNVATMSSLFMPHFNGKVIEIRHMGYNLTSAILELTDNSVRKTCCSKQVRVILQKDNVLLNRVSVLDDGCGMSYEKLRDSFIFNLLKDRQDGDIGKFHVGMKYALIAMGSQITLLSREVDGNIVGIFADIESMASRNSFKPCEVCEDVDDDWALRHITPRLWEQFKSSPSGTLVDVKNLVPSCRSPFDKTVDAVKKGLSTAYTSLYNDCQISLEDETKVITAIIPSDLFYYDDPSKLDELAYETTLKVYSQGIGRPERVIEVNTSHRRMPTVLKGCANGTPTRPVFYEFTEYEYGKNGHALNNAQVITTLPDNGDLLASFEVRVIQVKKPIFVKEKTLFPTESKLGGDRKCVWFNREIRCVGAAKQLGIKFSDRGHSASERQRMLVKTSCSADDLTGSKFNKQMDDNALPCRALNDALISIYKQVTDPWNKKYDDIAKKEKAAREAANASSEDSEESEDEDVEENENQVSGPLTSFFAAVRSENQISTANEEAQLEESSDVHSDSDSPSPSPIPTPVAAISTTVSSIAPASIAPASIAPASIPISPPPPSPTLHPSARLTTVTINLTSLSDIHYEQVKKFHNEFGLRWE